jgi:hypothetical protein
VAPHVVNFWYSAMTVVPLWGVGCAEWEIEGNGHAFLERIGMGLHRGKN